jgi:hypothetical protein
MTMKQKALTQKNTLLKNAQANAASNFFKRVFFSPPKKSTLPFFTNLFFPPHGFTANTNSCASNVNRFEQSVCGLQTTHLRTNSRAAANIRLKEILKRRALFGNQTVVLLIGSCGETNSGASNPFFLKLL